MAHFVSLTGSLCATRPHRSFGTGHLHAHLWTPRSPPPRLPEACRSAVASASRDRSRHPTRPGPCSLFPTVTLSKLRSEHMAPLTRSKSPRVRTSARPPPTGCPLPGAPGSSHEPAADCGTARHSHTGSLEPRNCLPPESPQQEAGLLLPLRPVPSAPVPSAPSPSPLGTPGPLLCFFFLSQALISFPQAHHLLSCAVHCRPPPPERELGEGRGFRPLCSWPRCHIQCLTRSSH